MWFDCLVEGKKKNATALTGIFHAILSLSGTECLQRRNDFGALQEIDLS